MTTFEERPKRVEAIQFTGGFDAAVDMLNWLYVRKVIASYSPEIINDGTVEHRETVLVPKSRDNDALWVRKDDWLVYDQHAESVFSVWTHQQLFEIYWEVSEQP